jgi:hypothetical protein
MTWDGYHAFVDQSRLVWGKIWIRPVGDQVERFLWTISWAGWSELFVVLDDPNSGIVAPIPTGHRRLCFDFCFVFPPCRWADFSRWFECLKNLFFQYIPNGWHALLICEVNPSGMSEPVSHLHLRRNRFFMLNYEVWVARGWTDSITSTTVSCVSVASLFVYDVKMSVLNHVHFYIISICFYYQSEQTTWHTM